MATLGSDGEAVRDEVDTPRNRESRMLRAHQPSHCGGSSDVGIWRRDVTAVPLDGCQVEVTRRSYQTN